MTGQIIGQLILWLIMAVIVIFILYWVMNWLYRRSTKEVAFVRTGFLGEKVVIDGGAFVWPIIHDITPVNMNSLQLAVTREKDEALITKDRMRIDVDAEFYVRVKQTGESVSLAASTMGRRTLEPERIHQLLSGKFISALRTVASEMTMEELHENRNAYVGRVLEAAQLGMDKNGLELESVCATTSNKKRLFKFANVTLKLKSNPWKLSGHQKKHDLSRSGISSSGGLIKGRNWPVNAPSERKRPSRPH